MGEYILKEVPTFGNTEAPTRYRAEMKYTGTETVDAMAERIADATTFDEGTVLGVVEALMSEMARQMAAGKHVKLGDLGTFYLTLDAPKVEAKRSLHAQNVSFGGVGFRASKAFLSRVKRTAITRARSSDDEDTRTYTETERLEMLLNYLEINTIITASAYSGLVNLKHTKACNELKSWSEAGLIERQGRAPHVTYSKK